MNYLQPKFNREIIKRPQTAKNIALQIKRAIYESEPAAKIIAPKFRGKSTYTTCFNVYDFLRKNIIYKAEPASVQTSRTMQVMLNDMINKKCYADCKHYTMFACSILRALGIRSEMYLISQNYFSKEPTHIYCVAFVNGKKIIVDPCINSFNREARHRYKYKMNF